MQISTTSRRVLNVYLVIFLLYLFIPLIIMVAATFNASRFPTVVPWTGTTLRWFSELSQDSKMWNGLFNSVWVAFAAVAISVPIGTMAALLLDSVGGRMRTVLYGL